MPLWYRLGPREDEEWATCSLSNDAQPVFFSYCCFIYCNFNLLPAPETYTTVQSLIIAIWRKVTMNQLFTRLNIKMAQNKIFAAFTDVKDSVVAQQPGKKKQTEHFSSLVMGSTDTSLSLAVVRYGRPPPTNGGFCSDEHIHLLLDLLTITEGH